MNLLIRNAEDHKDKPLQIRHKLKRMRFDTEEYEILKLTLDRLHGDYESPGWRQDALAHFVLPDIRLAIYLVQGHLSIIQIDRHLTPWRQQGWTATFIKPDQVQKLHTEGMLEIQLDEAIQECKNNLKKAPKA